MTKSVKLERVGEMSAFAEKEGGINAVAESVSGINASLEPGVIPFAFSFDRNGGIVFNADRLDGIGCTFTYTDRKDISRKYLEIEPEVLWVWPDLESLNDVYSNVTWHIN